MKRLIYVCTVCWLSIVLSSVTALADSQVICPPHNGRFPMEPGILNSESGKVTRIQDIAVRAVAKFSCDDPVCGNSVPEPGEQCDTGGESASCDADCTAVSCGDGVVNMSRAEECDDGNVVDGDGCSQDCKTETTPVCGNGIKEGTEECDDGNTIDNDNCTNACANPVCGDSIVWNQGSGFEQCDTGGSETSTCDVDCTSPACGDGLTNTAAGEQCDDGNMEDGDGCSIGCFLERDPEDWPEPGDPTLREDEICYWASLIAGFLDAYNQPGDDHVVYCHATGPGQFNYLDTNISSCFPHIDHPGDVFPSTLCDS